MRIAIPDLISNSYFPVIAAVELGLFKAEGLDMDLELLFPVTKAMEALRDKQFDFIGGAAHATLHAFPGWQGARLLAAQAQRMYWFLVLRADLGARPGDVAAVKGLRLGAAPGVDVGLQQLLRDAGIDLDRDRVQIGPVPGASQPSVSFGVTAAQALAEGKLDGFWANGMGAEVAVQRGVGTIVLDVRRGLAPEPSMHYTFPALVTTEELIRREPDAAAAAVRALTGAQRALKEDPSRATAIGKRLFPEMEANLIADLIRRDAPYYDPAIPPPTVDSLNRFAQNVGLLAGPVPYEQVVATQFTPLWRQ